MQASLVFRTQGGVRDARTHHSINSDHLRPQTPLLGAHPRLRLRLAARHWAQAAPSALLRIAALLSGCAHQGSRCS